MKNTILAFRNNPLAFGSLMLLLGTVIGNISGYAYHVVVGRILGPEKYAIIGALLSIFYILNVPAGVIATILTKYYAKNKAINDLGASKTLLIFSIKIVSILSLISIVFVCLFAKNIAVFLRIDSEYYIYALAGIFITFLFATVVNAFCIGYQEFSVNALFSGGSSVLRLIFCSIGSLFGVLVTLIGNIISNILSVFLLYPSISKLKKIPRSKTLPDFSSVIGYSLPTVVTLIAIASLFSSDVIIVKNRFPAQIAGMYAALAVLGKIIYFATFFIVQAVFPILAEQKEKGISSKKTFISVLVSVAGISFVITIVYFIFPSLVVRYLFGEAFMSIVPYVWRYALFMSFYCITNALAMMYLAIGTTSIWSISIFGAILQIIVLFIVPNTLENVLVANQIIIFVLTIFLALLPNLYARKK